MRAEYEGQPLRFFSANNTMKTYYGPLLLRPLSFLRSPQAQGAACTRRCWPGGPGWLGGASHVGTA